MERSLTPTEAEYDHEVSRGVQELAQGVARPTTEEGQDHFPSSFI